MTIFVNPGERFYVSYVSSGTETQFPIPDITAQTGDVSLFINGLAEAPVESYTVHAGLLSLTKGPAPAGFVLEIRS